MRETLELCCTPVSENCQQVGTAGYDHQKARQECEAFRRQLRRQFGEEPEGASLVIKSNPHDFGTYLEVAVKFDSDNEEAAEYAYKLEEELPEKWDDIAKNELREHGIFTMGAAMKSTTIDKYTKEDDYDMDEFLG